MTERMENALNHIKTSIDVDPWAVEEVERVFKAYEQTKEGHWIGTLSTARTNNGIELYGYVCSNCKKITYSSALTPRCCPWCGNNKVEGR